MISIDPTGVIRDILSRSAFSIKVMPGSNVWLAGAYRFGAVNTEATAKQSCVFGNTSPIPKEYCNDSRNIGLGSFCPGATFHAVRPLLP